MGLFAGIFVHARDRDEPYRRHDRRASHTRRARYSRWLASGLIAACAVAAQADTLRIATFNSGLSRDGPGVLLRDLLQGRDVGQIGDIARARPDILALQSFDFDHDQLALTALQQQLEALGHAMPYTFSRAPNSGVPTGFDLNRNGRMGEASDALGYGEFEGQDGLAVLARFPIDTARALDFSRLKWSQMAWATAPVLGGQPYFNAEEWDTLPLFSVAGWAVPIEVPGGAFWLLTGQSTPPVFDGPEDRNGLRNAAQLQFWDALVGGSSDVSWQLPSDRFAFAGGLNADPSDGDGPHSALRRFLENPAVQDIAPVGMGGAEDPDPQHEGDPARDTVRWKRSPGPGNLRVDYVLPSASLRVRGSGVEWPSAGVDDLDFRHFLVWVDVMIE